MEIVYCSECVFLKKYLPSKATDCTYPENMVKTLTKGDWLTRPYEIEEPFAQPSELNAKNDCAWFEKKRRGI
jgi:hypothetical protein